MPDTLGRLGEGVTESAETSVRQGMQVVQTCGMFLLAFFCYTLTARSTRRSGKVL